TCTETCDDRACGSACGQTCANTCEGDLICQESDGTCIENPCGNLTLEGCCDGSSLFYCDDFQVFGADCVAEAAGDVSMEKCGWIAASEDNEQGYYCADTEDQD